MIIQWEEPFRKWLSDQCSTTVMFGFPSGTPQYPVTTVERIGGGPAVAEDQPRARIRVWGNTKREADDLIFKFAKLLEDSDGASVPINDTITLEAAVIDRLRWAPDESLDGQPSYLMDATLVFIS